MCKNKFFIFSMFLFCFALLSQGCGKSKIVTSWMDDSQTGYHLDKVLVIAVFKDPITQNIYENSFVDLLKASGIEAFPGSEYHLGSQKPDKKAISSALTATGATSILITHILSETTNTYTIAPEDDYVAYLTTWDSIQGYHNYIYDNTFAPAETIEKRYERMAVTLFDAGGGKPVWSAISESINFEDRLKVDDEQLEDLFIKDLRKKKLL